MVEKKIPGQFLYKFSLIEKYFGSYKTAPGSVLGKTKWAASNRGTRVVVWSFVPEKSFSNLIEKFARKFLATGIYSYSTS